jgi:predicted lipid carrier protein YhbT
MLIPQLRRCIGMLPVKPPAVAICLLANRYLLPQLDTETRLHMSNRNYVIEVSDLGLVIGMAFNETGFMAASSGAAANLRITGSSLDFVRLAAREIDADTLFFSRRLLIQGETELALLVRNAFDSVDFGAIRGGSMLHRLLRGISRRFAGSSQ